jgi:hypothetical protein
VGEDWLGNIASFIERKPITIVLVSPIALEKPWVWFEVGASWSAGGRIVSVCCRRMTKAKLPDPLSRLQAADLTLQGMQEVIGTIAKLSNCQVTEEQSGAGIRKFFGDLVD